tara:strand:+ start:2124 stop:3605 length:1482 start_codon:yes stop_codon:yes gene_type:complete
MVSSFPIIGRRSTVSTAAFTGRATAPVQQDPVTTKLLNQNSLQLGLVATQITNLNTQVASLNTTLQAISTGLATSQAVERQKEEAEQARESRLAQEQLRQGQESLIEKKIEAAATAPAQKLATKASFTLGNLGKFFLSLVGGWLTSQAIDAINANAEGNKDKLQEIKINVLKGLGVITGVFVASRLALTALTGGFGRLAIGLTAAAAIGLFTTPGQQFLGFLLEEGRKFYESIRQNVPGGQLLPELPQQQPNANQPPGQQPPPEQQGQQPPSQQPPPANRPPGRALGGLVEGTPGIDQIPAMLTDGEFVMPQGKVKQYGLDFMESIRSGNTLFAENDNKDEFVPRDKEKPFDVNLEAKQTEPANIPLEGDASRGLEPGQISPGDTTLSEMGYSVDEVQGMINEEKYIGKTGNLPSSNITPIIKAQKVAERVSEPPQEDPINIVPIPIPPSGGGQSNQQSVPAASGSIGGIPVFATSDSSNMYVLTTKTIFNVL